MSEMKDPKCGRCLDEAENMTDISMVRGDTVAFGFEVHGLEGQELDAASLSCKKYYSDQNYAFQKTLGDGISEASENKYVVRVAPEDTEELALGSYYYDLELKSNGDVFTVLRGKLKILPEVTKE